MADIALNLKTGDVDFKDNAFYLAQGADAIVQQIFIRLRFLYGEWHLDTRQGMPYFERILVNAPDLRVIDSIFRSAIINVPGVSSLDSLDISFDREAGSLTVAFKATGNNSETIDSSDYDPFIIHTRSN